MALIDCPECGKKISDAANACPECGFPRSNAPAQSSQKSNQKKWNPAVAALLSLLVPGAGQIYKKETRHGLVWLLVVLSGYLLTTILGLILHLCCIINASTRNLPSAASQGKHNKVKLSRLTVLGSILIFVIFAAVIVNIFVPAEPITPPTPNSAPTLERKSGNVKGAEKITIEFDIRKDRITMNKMAGILSGEDRCYIGDLMVVKHSFYIVNNNDFIIRNVHLNCQTHPIYQNNPIVSRKYKVYDIIPAKGKSHHYNFNFGVFDHQSKVLKCTIIGFDGNL